MTTMIVLPNFGQVLPIGKTSSTPLMATGSTVALVWWASRAAPGVHRQSCPDLGWRFLVPSGKIITRPAVSWRLISGSFARKLPLPRVIGIQRHIRHALAISQFLKKFFSSGKCQGTRYGLMMQRGQQQAMTMNQESIIVR